MNKYEKIIKDNLISKFIKDIKPKNLIKELRDINNFIEKYQEDNFVDYDKYIKDDFYFELKKNKLKFYNDLIKVQKKIFKKAMEENLGYKIAIQNSNDIINDFSIGSSKKYANLCEKQLDELINNIVENDKVVDLFNHFIKLIENNYTRESLAFDLFGWCSNTTELFLNILDNKKYNFDIEKLKMIKNCFFVNSINKSIYEKYYNLCFIKQFESFTDSDKLDFMIKNVTLIIQEKKCIERDKILDVFNILITDKNLRDIFYRMSYEYEYEYKIKDNILYDIDDDDNDITIIKNKNPLLEYIYHNHKELFKLHYKEVILDGYLEAIKPTITMHNKILNLLEGEKNND